MTYTRISDYLAAADTRAGSRARHPSAVWATRATIRVGTYPDGSQVMIERHEDGRVTACRRAWPTDEWSSPVELEEE